MDGNRGCITEVLVGLVLVGVLIGGIVMFSNGVPNINPESGLTWDTSSVIMREQQRTERERIRSAAEVRKAEEAGVTQRVFFVALGVVGVAAAIAYGISRRPVPQPAQAPMLMVVYAAQLPHATVELIDGEWRVMDHQRRSYATESDVLALLTGARQ